MADTDRRRVPGLEVDWRDLSSEHRNRRETLEDSIDDWPNDRVQASYVIGAIGAGKTQLLTHLFKYAYREAGTPALYVTMGRLLDDIGELPGYIDAGEDTISQEQLHEAIEEIVRQKLEEIHDVVSSGGRLTRDHYLIDSGRIDDVDEYAGTVGIDTDRFAELTASDDQVILIVDEMEESYNRLGELVNQTTGPLREVVERIERQDSSFYLVGGFGYASVNELGEAEFRRVAPVTLPIIRPQTVPDMLGSSVSTARRNFVWWMSRARPGWLEIAESSFERWPERVTGTYDSLGDLVNPEMSRVDIISVEELEGYVSDLGEQDRDLTAVTIYRPAPQQIGSVSGLQPDIIEQGEPLLLADSELTSIDRVAEAFTEGAQAIDAYNNSIVSDQVVRRYLLRTLRAIGDGDGQLVFGAQHRATFRQGEICRQRVLDPLAERVHDMALEEAGDENSETVDFLYELSQHIQGTSADELSTAFGTFFELFTGSADLTEESYIGPGLRTLVTAFPSLITNPRLSFAAMSKSETEQFEEAVMHLHETSDVAETLQEFGDMISQEQT